MLIESTIIRYGDNIDTDVIIPARYLNSSDPTELAGHCMADLDSDFSDKARLSHIIVAGKNFGCGSSREHAPIAIKAAGIQLVIAESFSRIFFRNSVNLGLAIVECPQLVSACHDGDFISFDSEKGLITLNNADGYEVPPIPQFIQDIISCGGLMAYSAELGAGK